MNYGVDFTSGTTVAIKTSSATTTEQVREAATGAGVEKINGQSTVVQRDVTPGVDGATYTIKVPELTTAEVQKLSGRSQRCRRARCSPPRRWGRPWVRS